MVGEAGGGEGRGGRGEEPAGDAGGGGAGARLLLHVPATQPIRVESTPEKNHVTETHMIIRYVEPAP